MTPFGDPEQPKAVDELLCLLASEDAVRFWRGAADATWKLDSTIVRQIKNEGGRPTERLVQSRERDLLARGRHKGFGVHAGVRLSDFELLARLRHHGAATRLVDFSRSAVVALWFAVRENPDRDGLILGVHAHQVRYHEGVPLAADYGTFMGSLKGNEDPVSWEPSAVSPRVAAQHSHFLFSEVVNEDFGSLAIPTGVAGGVRAILVPSGLKAQTSSFLRSTLDIGVQTMFPDIDGFAVAFGANPPEDRHRW